MVRLFTTMPLRWFKNILRQTNVNNMPIAFLKGGSEVKVMILFRKRLGHSMCRTVTRGVSVIYSTSVLPDIGLEGPICS